MEYTIQGNILKVNDGVVKVGFDTFSEIADTITEIILPEGLEIIEDNTFFDNVNIEKILLPSTLTEIGTNAFWGLDELKYIYIPQSVKEIKADAFVNCINCTVLVEKNNSAYSTVWYKNIKNIKFNISKEDSMEEVVKILYSSDEVLSDEQKKAFSKFTIDILKTFPNFKYDEELELAYILAGKFVDYMQDLVGVNEIELDKALKYIEKLHKDKHQCIKELATIGFVENIQNTWSDDNKKIIYPKLGIKTKKSWDDLNKFWEGK